MMRYLSFSMLLICGWIQAGQSGMPPGRNTGRSDVAPTQIPTSVGPPKDREGPGQTAEKQAQHRQIFLSFSNTLHAGNRIGYRVLEHLPIVHGRVPGEATDRAITEKAEALERHFATRKDVYVHRLNVGDLTRPPWVAQTWTFYIVPLVDGFDLLWMIETGNIGLNDCYSVQQCFRMTGRANEAWRKTVAESPAFSEYDLWQEQSRLNQPRTSLSWVVRNGLWQPIPPIDAHVVCRTALGLQIDLDRSGGDLARIPSMEPPFQANTVSTFEPPIDDGLAARCDREGNWLNALWWENTTHISNHHPADCLHSFVNLGPLAANSKRALRGRIYWARMTKDELLARWRMDAAPKRDFHPLGDPGPPFAESDRRFSIGLNSRLTSLYFTQK